MGLILQMSGRTRKSGRREKNGRPARRYINPKAQVAGQPHRIGVPDHFREREEAESEFGRLMLNGRITPAEYEAGKRYRDLAMRYRSAVLSAKSAFPQAVDMFAIRGHNGFELAAWYARALKMQYVAAFEAAAEAGTRAQRAVKNHAVFEQKVRDVYSLTLLKLGLEKLVLHFGIDSNLQIRANVRNAS